MAIYVSQAFADAVEAWYEAAVAGGGYATGAWQKVMLQGLQIILRTNSEVKVAADAVLNGEAIVYRGQVIRMIGGAGGSIGGGEAGAATIAGIGIGLAAAVAVLAIAGGCVYVHEKNKSDMDKTRADALYLYLNQCWPRYVRFVATLTRDFGHAPPAPLSFDEFFEHRGERIVVPAKLS